MYLSCCGHLRAIQLDLYAKLVPPLLLLKRDAKQSVLLCVTGSAKHYNLLK
jgi:hypothetical protein